MPEDRRHIADMPANAMAFTMAGRFTDIVGYTALLRPNDD